MNTQPIPTLMRLVLPTVILTCLLSAGASAQVHLHVSTSGDVSLPSGVVEDAAVLTATKPTGPHSFFGAGHWRAVAGLVPTDVDAFARIPSMPQGSADSIAFSLLSNQGGFLDGDVLGLAPGGGFEVIVSEAELLGALGLPAANVDVDALDFDVQGCLLFSLQSDLMGTVLGDVADGDVLCYEPPLGKIWIERTEAEIQALFTLATGLSASIGDVQAIDHVAGNLWVVPQAPSSHDGAVLVCTPNPYFYVDEDGMGLGGAEVDALSLAEPNDDVPTFTLEPAAGAPGSPTTVTLRGQPNTIYIALMAGHTGWVDFSARPGFGAFYMDPSDPWLSTILGMPSPPYAVTDAQGFFTTPWTLPTASLHGVGFGGEEGWSFQVMELPSLETSAPFRVLKP
jgi:hypothetical protein